MASKQSAQASSDANFGWCMASFKGGDRDRVTMRFAWPAPPFVILPALADCRSWSRYRLTGTTVGKGKRPNRATYEAIAR